MATRRSLRQSGQDPAISAAREDPVADKVRQLAKMIQHAEHVVFVTGAGVCGYARHVNRGLIRAQPRCAGPA